MLMSIIQLSRLEKKLAGRKRSRNVTWKGLLKGKGTDYVRDV
jgi:hypothetical protein